MEDNNGQGGLIKHYFLKFHAKSYSIGAYHLSSVRNADANMPLKHGAVMVKQFHDNEMENFIYGTPTKIYLGRGKELEAEKIIKDFNLEKVLLHCDEKPCRQTIPLLARRKKHHTHAVRHSGACVEYDCFALHAISFRDGIPLPYNNRLRRTVLSFVKITITSTESLYQ